MSSRKFENSLPGNHSEHLSNHTATKTEYIMQMLGIFISNMQLQYPRWVIWGRVCWELLSTCTVKGILNYWWEATGLNVCGAWGRQQTGIYKASCQSLWHPDSRCLLCRKRTKYSLKPSWNAVSFFPPSLSQGCLTCRYSTEVWISEM